MTIRSEDGERLGRHERRLRFLLAHLAGRAIRSRVELDDLVQEVWLRALTSARGLPPVDPADPADTALARLLARIARNTVVDVARALRTKKRDRREVPLQRSDWSSAGPRASALAAHGPGPHTRVAGAEDEARLLASFERLAPEHRRVIGLRQFEGLSARAAAARLGRSETAVHSLYRRALAAWQESLGAPGGRDEARPEDPPR